MFAERYLDKSDIIWLSVNNTTYAKIGALRSTTGWWDIYPLPPNTPPELADASKYGRISAWGFGRVIESTCSDAPVSSMVWGYLPIGTLPVDLTIETGSLTREVVDVSSHRTTVLPLYNSYLVYSPTDISNTSKDFKGWTAVLWIPFITAWLLNRNVFAWDEELLVPPSSQVLSWTMKDANLSEAVIILLSASSKTAVMIAQQLREARPLGSRPKKIVGVTSSTSHLFAQATGFYDIVVDYNEAQKVTNLADMFSIHKSTKVSLLNCGARGDAHQIWYNTLQPYAESMQTVLIGFRPEIEPPEVVLGQLTKNTDMSGQVLSTADVVEGATLKDSSWLDHSTASFKEFLAKGNVPGLSLQWGQGMDDVKET
ncbi:hypothetical protein B7463_g8360, partial [Scytalidium lignicola]